MKSATAQELYLKFGHRFKAVKSPDESLRSLTFVRLEPEDRQTADMPGFYTENCPTLSLNNYLRAMGEGWLQERMKSGDITFFCALMDDRPVGYIALFTPEFARLSRYTAIWPCIDKRFRRHAVATYLFLALLFHCVQDLNVHKVVVKLPTFESLERLLRQKFCARQTREKRIMYDLLLVEF